MLSIDPVRPDARSGQSRCALGAEILKESDWKGGEVSGAVSYVVEK